MTKHVVKSKNWRRVLLFGLLSGVLGLGSFIWLEIRNLTEAIAYTLVLELDGPLAEFHDLYAAVPGDLSNPSAVIDLCKEGGCGAGNGDGRVGTPITEGADIRSEESEFFWQHMQAAGLVSSNFSGGSKWGNLFVVYHQGGKPLPYSFSANEEGNYFVWLKGYKIDKKAVWLNARQAERIDLKLDDGFPLTGDVVAAGNEKCVGEGPENIVIYNYEDDKKCLFLYKKLESYGEK